MNDQRKSVVLIDSDTHSNRQLMLKIQESNTLKVIYEITKLHEVWPALQSSYPDVVVVGGLVEIEIGAICQQIKAQFPHAICIAACSQKDVGWETFLRSIGVFVITKPIQVNQIELLSAQLFIPPAPQPCLRESMPMQQENKSKQLITIYGPKGGVGKTFISRELAIYFTQQQTDQRPCKVLAVDFNLDLGTFATTLNMPRNPNIFTLAQLINEHLQRIARMNGRPIDSISHHEWQEYSLQVTLPPDELSQFVVVHQESGLHILTSPRDIRNSFEIKDYHLYVILESLKQSDYDVILIDTAPDTTDATIQALFFAEKVIMVGNPVVDAIENIHRMLKLLREANYPEERIQICINRLQRKEMFTLEEIRGYFQLHPSKMLFTIPDDEEVKRSINAGKPLMLSAGRSPAKDALVALGKTLHAHLDAPKTETKKKEASIFSKWFRPLKRGNVR
ncbi:AAA family ATPase [Brevibacillus sp. SYSU BS000544]|uniref:AAA family ATPase n=1 Tax=Brevibacillus sp. SYSU BS000544 TaxID=3416443 RepID=UPI003CE56D4B